MWAQGGPGFRGGVPRGTPINFKVGEDWVWVEEKDWQVGWLPFLGNHFGNGFRSTRRSMN